MTWNAFARVGRAVARSPETLSGARNLTIPLVPSASVAVPFANVILVSEPTEKMSVSPVSAVSARP